MVRIISALIILFFLLPSAVSFAAAASPERVFISHRGGMQGFGESNIQATIFNALEEDDSYIELEVVLSSDNQPVVFHDIYLENTTNVSEVFPERARDDGRYYVIDFTLAELKGLQFTSNDGETELYLSGFEEQLKLIRQLEKRPGKQIGIAPKLVKTWFHKLEGKDLSARTVSSLQKYGYLTRESKILLQSYDSEELQRMHVTLLPMMQMDIPLVQLIGNNDGEQMKLVDGSFTTPYSFDWIFTNFGLRALSRYADAVGITWQPEMQEPQLTRLTRFIEDSKKLSLATYVTLLKQEQDKAAYEEQLDQLLYTLQVDGINSNATKKVIDFIKMKDSAAPSIHELLPQLNINNKETASSPLSILKEIQ